jgi:hypothetical protein
VLPAPYGALWFCFLAPKRLLQFDQSPPYLVREVLDHKMGEVLDLVLIFDPFRTRWDWGRLTPMGGGVM